MIGARTAAMLVVGAALAGCPKATDPAHAAPVRIALAEAGPYLCISAIPSAEPMKNKLVPMWRRGLDHLQRGELDQAADALAQAGDHPAVAAARAALTLLQGKTERARAQHDELLRQHPDDLCLLYAAAQADLAAGDEQRARDRTRAVWQQSQDDPDPGMFLALLELRAEHLDETEKILAAISERYPDHLPSAEALAGLYLQNNQPGKAIPMLERLMQGGVDVKTTLFMAYYAAGRTADYLRLASEQGLPLGDDGAVSAAEDPQAAFQQLLGVDDGQQLVVTIDTTLGAFHCTLLHDQAPVTVANFVGLARGTIPWTADPAVAAEKKPLYDGTIFHRVIPEFMVQGGDPLGTGTGGPGYRFHDEISPHLSFDRAGVLAMANAGPATNGSQFFITEKPTKWLDGLHTIFGQCDEASVTLVKKMAAVDKDAQNRPREPIQVNSVRFHTE